MTYVDATTNNTSLASGAPIIPGPDLNQWHERTGSGNGGALLASADVTPENAAVLKTVVTVPGQGVYDLWINFWGNPGADWRIRGGLSTNDLRLFRQRACKQVEPGDHDSALVLTNDNQAFLYQAYLGRVTTSGSNTVAVFVDDHAISAGTSGPLAADTVRTWYDGVSYARVIRLQITNAAYHSLSNTISLTWTSTLPETSLALPTYKLLKLQSLTDPGWTTVVAELFSAGLTTSYTDNLATGTAAFYRVSTP
jgi:hypothetical protein